MTGKIRVYCGLVLFTYVTVHLINHSLGSISFDALSAGLKIHLAVWRSWPGTVLLYGALTVHIALVLWRLYTRRNFKYKRWEAWQVVLGFSIPILLGGHVFFQRVGSSMLGIAPSYELQQLSIWVFSPVIAVIMPLGLIVVWTHGCIGIHFWLRLKPWWGDVWGRHLWWRSCCRRWRWPVTSRPASKPPGRRWIRRGFNRCSPRQTSIQAKRAREPTRIISRRLFWRSSWPSSSPGAGFVPRLPRVSRSIVFTIVISATTAFLMRAPAKRFWKRCALPESHMHRFAAAAAAVRPAASKSVRAHADCTQELRKKKKSRSV